MSTITMSQGAMLVLFLLVLAVTVAVLTITALTGDGEVMSAGGRQW